MSDLNGNNPSGNGRTVLAVVLMVVVVTVGVVFNEIFFPPQPTASTTAAKAVDKSQSAATTTPVATSIQPAPTSAFVAAPSLPVVTNAQAPTAAEPAIAQYTVSTDLLEAVFTNKGGELLSLKLKKHKDSSEAVNLVLPGPRYQSLRGILRRSQCSPNRCCYGC